MPETKTGRRSEPHPLAGKTVRLNPRSSIEGANPPFAFTVDDWLTRASWRCPDEVAMDGGIRHASFAGTSGLESFQASVFGQLHELENPNDFGRPFLAHESEIGEVIEAAL